MSLQNPQIGSTHLTLSTSAADKTYIAPFIAQMNADAAGTVGVLQRAQVSITGVDETFDLCLSTTESVKLLNAFNIFKSDSGAIDGVLDTSAGVTVNMREPINFKAALRAALEGAMSTGLHMPVDAEQIAEKRNITDYLKRETYVDTKDQLAYDTLANLLEASDLASFSIQLDISGAAANMFDAMSKTAEEAPNAARYRRTLFTQLPELNVELYLAPKAGDLSGNYNAEDVSGINFLPFRSNDRLYFVFDAVVGETSANAETGIYDAPTSGAKIDRVVKDTDFASKVQVGSDGMAGTASLSAKASEYANGASLTFSAPTKRRIGVAIRVAKDQASTTAISEQMSVSIAPFNILLNKGVSGESIIDPSGANYPFQVAAGLLLSPVSLELTASSPVAAPIARNMPVATAADVDLSGQDLSGGAHATGIVIADLGALPQMSEGIKASWLIVNTASNMNQFVLVDNKVEYHARIATSVADTALLYYVSNVELSGAVGLSGVAAYKNAV